MTKTRSARFAPLALTALAPFGLVLAGACGGTPKPDTDAPKPPSTPAVAVPDAAVPSAAPSSSASAAGGKMTAADCDALATEANETLDAERIKVDKQCKKNEDCMAIKGRACTFNCENGAIPKAEEKDWTGALSKVKDGQCKKWTDNECSKLNTRPPPTCTAKKPVCEAGHCALK